MISLEFKLMHTGSQNVASLICRASQSWGRVRHSQLTGKLKKKCENCASRLSLVTLQANLWETEFSCHCPTFLAFLQPHSAHAWLPRVGELRACVVEWAWAWSIPHSSLQRDPL